MKLNISEDLKLPIEAVTQTFAILAKRGVGKTYTGAVMIEEMLSAGQQVVVVDPIGVWWGLHSSADGKSPGFPIVIFGGEHADVPLEEGAGEIIAASIIEHGFSAILDLSLLRKAAQVRFMTAFAEALYRLNRKPLHITVDEADAFAPQKPMPGEQRLLGSFEDIVRRGRARGLGVTLITQRSAVLNKNVLTQIEVLVALRTISPQDRKAIEAWIEVHGTPEKQARMMEELPSLPVGTAWFWSPGWLDIFKRVQVRKRITFDSSSTPKVGEKVIAPKAVAAVDLSKLGDQIKSTVEKAKENDPVALKARVRELERQVKSAQAAPAKREAQVKPAQLLTNADRKRLTSLTRALEKIVECARDAVLKSAQLGDVPRHFAPEIEHFRKLLNGPWPPAAIPKAAYVPVPAVKFNHPRAKPLAPARSDANGVLGKCERAILSALAQYPQGRTAVQVAVLTGYSVNSGGFNNSLGKLRSNEYITRSQPIQITQPGMDALADGIAEDCRVEAIIAETVRGMEKPE